MDMSETYGSTGTQHDDTTRELESVETSPSSAMTGSATAVPGSSPSGMPATTSSTDTKDVAKDEVRATGEQAKEGARHVAEVGKDEALNVAHETSQQAKELWQQTRSQLIDQSAQQQTKVAEGLRSLSQELSSMARGSDQQGVASDLAQQASQRMGDVAGWLDQRDPGSLVSEVKQFARQRPGAFLAAAATIGLVAGRLSRGLVADHQDHSEAADQTEDAGRAREPADHGATSYSTYGSATGTPTPAGDHPATDTLPGAGSIQGGNSTVSGNVPVGGTGGDGFPR